MRPGLNISTNSRRAAARPDPGLSLALPNESLPRISESLTRVNPSLVLANESIALASHLPAFESHASITRANNSFTSVNESKTLVSEMTSSPAVRPGHQGTTPRKPHKTSHSLPKLSRAFSPAHHQPPFRTPDPPDKPPIMAHSSARRPLPCVHSLSSRCSCSEFCRPLSLQGRSPSPSSSSSCSRTTANPTRSSPASSPISSSPNAPAPPVSPAGNRTIPALAPAKLSSN